MGLRDKYQAATPTSAAPTGQPAGSPAGNPASELAALRAKLAGRGNVNPPEATIPDDAMTRTTRETADGGAEAIPSTDASTPAEPSSAAPPAESVSKTARARSPKKPPAAAEAPSAAGVDPVMQMTHIGRDVARIADALEQIAALVPRGGYTDTEGAAERWLKNIQTMGGGG